MDFFKIKERPIRGGGIEIYPDFIVGKSKDLMIRGKSFYAVWDEEKNLWLTDEYSVQELVDRELRAYKEKVKDRYDVIQIRTMSDFSSGSWALFKKYISNISDNSHQLDTRLTFLNTPRTKRDYISRYLPYDIEEGPCNAYNELMEVLYDGSEREKLEWAIGAIVSGDSKDIQKFVVLYGEAGSGKSTVLNIIQMLFEGYYTAFEAKSLTSSQNVFSTEVFRSNPLVAIQHDGDLSKIEDNTRLNSIVSHEMMTMNEKYKPSYMARANCFLFMATNRPVKITDAKSGIIRRLIDVHPSGRKIASRRYHELMSQITFEKGAIANHCLNVYRAAGKNRYAGYRPLEMIAQTDVFYNFMENYYELFESQDGIGLAQAYTMYKAYCDDALVEFKLPKHKFREELRNYFRDFFETTRIDDRQVRSYFSGFVKSRFSKAEESVEEKPSWLTIDSEESLLDRLIFDCPAQYATSKGTPEMRWSKVSTTLKDIDTRRVHYVKLPSNHIVIDFDLKVGDSKSVVRNLEAASKWPPTYAEFSKSGSGIHLHYFYHGDVSEIATLFEPGIEIKTFTGDAAIRRKVSKCNTYPVATLQTGLPKKEKKPMINFEGVKSEKGLRTLIERNLKKEIHPATKPSIDFIHKILEEFYVSGQPYDVRDLRPAVLRFALKSTNNSEYCVGVVAKMKFSSSDEDPEESGGKSYVFKELVFFDVEVFKNLFVVVWKRQGHECVSMVNPTSEEIEPLMRMKLLGFNNRKYDNHILFARYLGYSNIELYDLSVRIIHGEGRGAGMFGEAYNISYADVYDFSTKKQSLKKFQVELGLNHKELSIPWDDEVPEEMVKEVVEYCVNDVITLEQVFENRKADFVAQEILADLAGGCVNDTVQQLASKLIFGNDRNPQNSFVYTDLSEMFPGYKFENGVSTYRGIVVGEGGRVYAEPGFYTDVALLDVVSMHPEAIELLNLFGPYTERYAAIKKARVAIKHKDYETARKYLGDRIADKYLVDGVDSDALGYALKIVINRIYGLTSASFSNKFRDPRNKDNIVAKRGALFMIDLQYAVQEQGYLVAHVKTDSIKIPNATPEIIQFVHDFGKKYGYTFEHEATYSKFCLVNDAVYIAQYKDGKKAGQWTATGAEFAHPYVFKKLFSGEEISFEDLIEVKTVTSSMVLDLNEGLPEDEHNYMFVGRAGAFCPVIPGSGGGILLRKSDDKYSAVTGTKGYRWLQSAILRDLKKEDCIDLSYFERLVESARKHIEQFTPFSNLKENNHEQ